MKPVLHELKILPEYFSQVRRGLKTAEIRLDDRDYCAGDTLWLKEWKPQKKVFTGRQIEVHVLSILRLPRVISGTFIDDQVRRIDWVQLSFTPISSIGCRLVMPEQAYLKWLLKDK